MSVIESTSEVRTHKPGVVPTVRPDKAIDVARELAATYAVGAADRDRERRLPTAEIGDLRAGGLLALTVPVADGGSGGWPSTIAQVLRILATADPNIAQIPQSHFVYLNLLRLAGNDRLRAEIHEAVVHGAMLGNAQAELKGPTAAAVETTLSPRPGGSFVLHGRKGYSTGALFATWIPVLATLPGGAQAVAFLPRGTKELTIVDDWDGFGQRTTASGQVHLDQVAVPAYRVVPRNAALTGPFGYGAYAQLMHGAIDAGLAEGALAESAEFARTKARPHAEAGVARAVDDPLTIQRAGELDVRVRAALAQLDVAGRAVDAVYHRPDDDLAAEASLAVAAFKILANDAALEVTTAGFELSGTRATARSENLDRHWRNARTHTLHDPVRWKYQHLGRHLLTGQRPSSTGTL